MKVPLSLSNAFDRSFEALISEFSASQGLLPDLKAIRSERFLSRSVVPHVKKLSALFNREKEGIDSIDPYWKKSSNSAHLRLAYFLSFLPCNLYRVASVWAELARLGFRWQSGSVLKAVDFGAGPASAACGIAAAESHASVGLPKTGNWALIERDQSILELGKKWARFYFENQGQNPWEVRSYHRRISLDSLLPRTAPRFNLWIMSFFLNEFPEKTQEIARSLLESWERHLENEGIIILIEPALKIQSRRLLELRKSLIEEIRTRKQQPFPLQVLLPCLGHQGCGALANPEDWCHEEVSWWRPPYLRIIDKMAHLDRKTLPFSYLVLIRSEKPTEEILPALVADRLHRLVSPSHSEGRDSEFYICGQEGKRKARYRPEPGQELGRGDILQDAEIRGDRASSRIERLGKIV